MTYTSVFQPFTKETQLVLLKSELLFIVFLGNLVKVQMALVIRGLFICGFAYSWSKKVYQTSGYEVFPCLFVNIFIEFTQFYKNWSLCSLIIRGFKIRSSSAERIYRELRAACIYLVESRLKTLN